MGFPVEVRGRTERAGLEGGVVKAGLGEGLDLLIGQPMPARNVPLTSPVMLAARSSRSKKRMVMFLDDAAFERMEAIRNCTACPGSTASPCGECVQAKADSDALGRALRP
jgi:hypothetical protein